VILPLFISLIVLVGTSPIHANDFVTIGTQEVGFTFGPVLPLRLTPAQSSKLEGVQGTLKWGMTITEIGGAGWFDGHLSLGAEFIGLHTGQPVDSFGAGAMPTIKYMFRTMEVVRFFVEGGGGGMWTDLGGQVSEQSSELNFVLMAGGGLSWFASPKLAISAGYRFYHISNAGLGNQNNGLNYNYPFLGLSYFYP
jgi:hypothetical protein